MGGENEINLSIGQSKARFEGQWLRDGHRRLVAKYDDMGDQRRRAREGEIAGNGDQRMRQLGKDERPK
jgi:hypothetical protein